MKLFFTVLMVTGSLTGSLVGSTDKCWLEHYGACSDSLSWEDEEHCGDLDLECQTIAEKICNGEITEKVWKSLQQQIADRS